MSPRERTFNREAVLDSALSIVRGKGWDGLTARGLAQRLKASVAPVYSAFGSMEALGTEVLREARRLLVQSTTRAYTKRPFLNIGVGIAVFAREEPNLFRALFHTRHHDPGILEGFDASILERMKADPMLRPFMSDDSLRRLLDNLWMYTLGLATSIIYGQMEDPSTGAIIRTLMNAGNMMIYGEISGLADGESAENEKAWARLAAEKNIAWPVPGAAHGTAGGTTKGGTNTMDPKEVP
jgi:AcrR family transcriptional regulator